jgi:preprotein translocase subunit YajC
MGQGGAAAGEGPPGYSYLLLWGSLFAIFYFLIIRPQQQKQKQHNQMINNLKKGDRVITGGGIHGRIVNLDESTVKMEIDEKVVIKVNRASIAAVLSNPQPAKPEGKTEKTEKGKKA